MHEKTKDFIVALWKAGIPGGCCLECFEWKKVDGPYGGTKTVRASIDKEQKVALVAALVEAGFSLDRIRKGPLVERRGFGDLGPTDKELLEGEWLLGSCPMVYQIVEAVEKLHAGTE